MNLLTKLEKSKTCWFLLGIIVLFFFLRLPSLIEPNWYGDEGIYQVLGQAMHSGRMLYSEAWDNKPPFLYITYALFDGDQFWVRSASLIVGLLSLIVFFFLSKRLLKSAPVAVLTSLLFTLLFATPLIEGNIANAENFILLPVIVAGFLIYQLIDKQKTVTVLTPRWALLTAGVLLGVAFLFKIVAIFDFATMVFFLVLVSLPKHFSKGIHTQLVWIRPLLHQFLFLIAGFLLPVIVTCLYFF
ncbi:phospholipid carrier-dependent glycosyltransferase, partial [Candidatus Microgenomates bacterium]|nr:phospholipid carrier-dependent glycosyltransferase [Candidatus Microgenomates bacterium]